MKNLQLMTLVAITTSSLLYHHVNCFTSKVLLSSSSRSRSTPNSIITFYNRNNHKGVDTTLSLLRKQYYDTRFGTNNYSYRHNNINIISTKRFLSQEDDTSSTTSTNTSSSSSSSNNNNNKARVLFLGTPDVAATSLQRIYQESIQDDSTFELVGVVTQPPKRRKRKGKVIPSPVGIMAEELNIPVLWPEKVRMKKY